MDAVSLGYIERPFAPAARLVGRLRYAQKFALIAAVMIVPLAWVTQSYLGVQSSGTAFAVKERVGAEYLRPATDLLLRVVAARSLAVRVADPQPMSSQLRAATSRVDAAVAALDGFAGDAQTLGLTTQWTALRRQVAGVLAAAPGTPAHAFAAYNGLSAGIESLIANDGNNSNMILDPTNDAYDLMDAVLNRLTVEMDLAGQASDLQTVIRSGGRPTLAKRLTSKTSRARSSRRCRTPTTTSRAPSRTPGTRRSSPR